MTEKRRDRRVAMSFSPEQVIFLADMLTTIQRGGDVRVMIRHGEALRLLRLIYRGKARAEAWGAPKPKIGRRLERCRHGHKYTELTAYIDPSDGYRRCKVCINAAKQRSRERMLQRQLDVVYDAALLALAEQRTA